MSYWLYQHLGNLARRSSASEGMLDELPGRRRTGDAARVGAAGPEEFTPVAGGYRFSVSATSAASAWSMIDARNGRVLEPGTAPDRRRRRVGLDRRPPCHATSTT